MPTDPLDPMEMPGEMNAWEYHKQRLKEGKLQLLEEERLGSMLVKAWKGEYENAREILQEVRSYLQQIGVRMDGEDEVLFKVYHGPLSPSETALVTKLASRPRRSNPYQLLAGENWWLRCGAQPCSTDAYFKSTVIDRPSTSEGRPLLAAVQS
ncbi:hypothetical protein IFM51744_03224 [Aspergillus udagawae]|nr:hypothetical protein IFM51744_03224 [Aspergillus udagawae]